MAKYDVFISYSRKDTSLVQTLIDRLRREIPNLKIWYDIEGIESAAVFQTKIIDAIDDSALVILSCSDNSLASEYCRKEIMYAKNTDKTVIPYLLPGAKLRGWLLFEFGTINCINSTKEDEVSRMIKDLKQWFGTKQDARSYSSKQQLDDTNNGSESGGGPACDARLDSLIGRMLENSFQTPHANDKSRSTSDKKGGFFSKLFGSVQSSDSGREQKTPTKPESDSKKNPIEMELVFDPVSGVFRSVEKGSLMDDPEAMENVLGYDLKSDQFKNVPKNDTSLKGPKALKGSINGHEYVDLGLPSGLKWATLNIGAGKQEESGVYFAWGEIKPKSSYEAQNSLTYDMSIHVLELEDIVGADGRLKPSHDAARQNWGAAWRMPTKKEIDELAANTFWEWTSINGVKGTILRSKTNANSIFLPAGGWYNYGKIEYAGEYGDYWSASMDPDDPKMANYMYNMVSGVSSYKNSRFLGFPIRPVSD